MGRPFRSTDYSHMLISLHFLWQDLCIKLPYILPNILLTPTWRSHGPLKLMIILTQTRPCLFYVPSLSNGCQQALKYTSPKSWIFLSISLPSHIQINTMSIYTQVREGIWNYPINFIRVKIIGHILYGLNH